MTDLFRKPATAVDAGELSAEERNKAEILKMEKVRQRIDAIVGDAATAEALKPYYHYFCKRPGFSDDYLQVFNRANVTLVDTAGKGVRSEEHTSELQSLMRISYAVFCLKKNKQNILTNHIHSAPTTYHNNYM